MKTLLVIAVLMFGIGTVLFTTQQVLDAGTALFAKRHAHIEALSSN
jgi:hypothetical protein